MQYTTPLDAQLSSPVYQSLTSPIESDNIDQSDDSNTKGNKNKSKKITYKPHQKFSIEDDAILRALVSTFGESSWILIAEHMPGRNSRQCRERWLNYLSPRLNRQKFTKEEDQLLISKVEEYGTKWVTISKSFFPNRTDQMVKNRYYILKRKAEKKKAPRNSSKKCKIPVSNDEISNVKANSIDIPVPINEEKILDLYDYNSNIDNEQDDENSFFDLTDDIFEQSFFGNNNFELHSF